LATSAIAEANPIALFFAEAMGAENPGELAWAQTPKNFDVANLVKGACLPVEIFAGARTPKNSSPAQRKYNRLPLDNDPLV
jgi:hypothetical protein